MSGELTKEERRFLEAVAACGGLATARHLPGANRAQDKARQACRRRMLAAYEGTAHGHAHAGWVITERGRSALSVPASLSQTKGKGNG